MTLMTMGLTTDESREFFKACRAIEEINERLKKLEPAILCALGRPKGEGGHTRPARSQKLPRRRNARSNDQEGRGSIGKSGGGV
jgi:hypothetical protein